MRGGVSSRRNMMSCGTTKTLTHSSLSLSLPSLSVTHLTQLTMACLGMPATLDKWTTYNPSTVCDTMSTTWPDNEEGKERVGGGREGTSVGKNEYVGAEGGEDQEGKTQ